VGVSRGRASLARRGISALGTVLVRSNRRTSWLTALASVWVSSCENAVSPARVPTRVAVRLSGSTVTVTGSVRALPVCS
jgi:hypothetical protein